MILLCHGIVVLQVEVIGEKLIPNKLLALLNFDSEITSLVLLLKLEAVVYFRFVAHDESLLFFSCSEVSCGYVIVVGRFVVRFHFALFAAYVCDHFGSLLAYSVFAGPNVIAQVVSRDDSLLINLLLLVSLRMNT